MRLIIFTSQFPPEVGGVQTMTWELSRHLQSQGVEVSVLAPRLKDCDAFDRGQLLRIKRYCLSDPQTSKEKVKQKISLINTLKQAIKETGADCVICTSWDPCAYIASMACRSKTPYFVIAHGMELMQLPSSFGARKVKEFMRRRALIGAKRIFAVSHFTAERAVQLGIPGDRIVVVPNGVSLNETSVSTPKANVLMTLSRLVPRKGHDTVLRAMPLLLQQIPNAVYRIVGTGPELTRLQALTRQLHLEEHVEFHGQVDDARREELLSECNVFVLATRATPTDFEGLGIGVLEAMKKGKPVIVTRAGGVPELVEHGKTGLIVEPDDPKALSSAITELFANPARANAMGDLAGSVVRDRYDWKIIADRYLKEIMKASKVNRVPERSITFANVAGQ